MKSLIRSRPEHGWCSLGLLLLLALAPLPAAASAVVSEEAKAQAREKFTEGNTAYTQGDFRKALAAFDAAYKLAPLPGFLFNVAQCHRQLGSYERAAFFYQRYLTLSEKEPANAATVKELIAEMKAKQREADTRRAERDKVVEAKARKVEKERARPASHQEPEPRDAPKRAEGVKEPERPALDIRTSRALSVPPEAMPNAPVAEAREPLSRKWWVWAGAGAAAVVAGGIVYAVTAPDPRPTTLGTIRAR